MAPEEPQNLWIESAQGEQFMLMLLENERRIYGFILSLVHNWSDADDLMQETCTVLWRKYGEFTPGTNFTAWALSVARFQVMNFLKQKRSHRVRLGDDNMEAIADRMLQDQTHRDQRREALEGCLAKLSDRDRHIIQMRYVSGATTQEVARQLGRSVFAVYKALNRIHQVLLDCIRSKLARGEPA